MWLCFFLLVAFYTNVLPCQQDECTGDLCTLEDPRKFFKADMTNYINPKLNLTELYEEITAGKGYVTIPQVFTPSEIKHARDLIHYLIKTQGKKATHFQGYEKAKPELQARVWNLLNKGKIWEKIVQHPLIVNIGAMILGDDFQLGSIATDTIFPGGSGQEPHIDYPYWDYHDRKHWPAKPKVKEVPFHMNMQVTIPLDDFTAQNGATAVRPGSQLEISYPSDGDEFYANMVQTTGKAGDMIIFVGLLHHCAMPNRSNDSRTGVIIQYLPKYVRPMEDLKRSVKPEVLKRASPVLHKLLLLDYDYPAVLDEFEATSTEGSKSKLKTQFNKG